MIIFDIDGGKERIVQDDRDVNLPGSFSKSIDLFGASPSREVAVHIAGLYQVVSHGHDHDDRCRSLSDAWFSKNDQAKPQQGRQNHWYHRPLELAVQITEEEGKEVLRFGLAVTGGPVATRFADTTDGAILVANV